MFSIIFNIFSVQISLAYPERNKNIDFSFVPTILSSYMLQRNFT